VLARVRVALLVGASAVALTACGAGATAAEPPPPPTAVEPIKSPQPVRLLTRCGIEWAKFDGRTWRATLSRPEPADLPDSSGLIHYDGFTKGTMTLLAPDRARFDVTDPLVKPIPGGVDFTPTDEAPPLCQ
jgi:hypothetical protein